MEFVTAGSPKILASAVENCAVAQGSLTAVVVPWESDGATLSMAIASSTGDGWAIEHTNLGTITLTDLGNGATRVVITSHDPDHPAKQSLVALFERFARQVQRRFESESSSQ